MEAIYADVENRDGGDELTHHSVDSNDLWIFARDQEVAACRHQERGADQRCLAAVWR